MDVTGLDETWDYRNWWYGWYRLATSSNTWKASRQCCRSSRWYTEVDKKSYRSDPSPGSKTAEKKLTFKKANIVLSEIKQWRSYHHKEKNTNCSRWMIKIKRLRLRYCVPDFWEKLVPLKACFFQGRMKLLLQNWRSCSSTWTMQTIYLSIWKGEDVRWDKQMRMRDVQKFYQRQRNTQADRQKEAQI